MYRFVKYLLAFASILFFSCQKQNIEAPDRIYSEGGLISFSTRVISKAPIITTLDGEDFGVYGYSFSKNTDWNTAKAKATPNIFHNQLVTCSQGGACDYTFTPIIVNGNQVLDYETLLQDKWREWDINKWYSFFAYYPYHSLDSGILKPSGSQELDIPYVDYTLPISSSGMVNPDDLLDVMTAQRTDYNVTLGTSVRLTFHHRLYCIDLYAHNFTGNDIRISDLTVEISGIHYNKAKIYLDRARTVYDEGAKQNVLQPIIPLAEDWNPNESVARFRIMDSGFEGITVGKGATTCLSTYTNPSLGEMDKNIMLIPQNSALSGSIPLKVRLSFIKDGAKDPTICDGTYAIDLVEGTKYSLTLNFVGDDVTLVDVSKSNWDKINVDHTFD